MPVSTAINLKLDPKKIKYSQKNEVIMSSAVKQEFFRWIENLNSSKLTDIECKLLNLLVNHFDTLAPLAEL